MEVKIKRTNNGFRFDASNGTDSITISASPELSGESVGFRPMQLVLSSLGSCMSIDVLNILYKQKQEISKFDVNVSGVRTDSVPSVFTSIRIDFIVKGDVDEDKLEKAIALSREKYCSVYRMLSASVRITTNYQLQS